MSTPWARNEAIPRSAGVNVNWVKVRVFMLAGLLSGVAGVLGAIRLGIGQIQIGEDQMFPAQAAVVIGGTALSGGKGGVQRTLVGVLIMTILNNGLLMCNVSAYITDGVQGLIILNLRDPHLRPRQDRHQQVRRGIIMGRKTAFVHGKEHHQVLLRHTGAQGRRSGGLSGRDRRSGGRERRRQIDAFKDHHRRPAADFGRDDHARGTLSAQKPHGRQTAPASAWCFRSRASSSTSTWPRTSSSAMRRTTAARLHPLEADGARRRTGACQLRHHQHPRAQKGAGSQLRHAADGGDRQGGQRRHARRWPQLPHPARRADSVLNEEEVQVLFKQMRKLADRGHAIVFVSTASTKSWRSPTASTSTRTAPPWARSTPRTPPTPCFTK